MTGTIYQKHVYSSVKFHLPFELEIIRKSGESQQATMVVDEEALGLNRTLDTDFGLCRLWYRHGTPAFQRLKEQVL